VAGLPPDDERPEGIDDPEDERAEWAEELGLTALNV